MNANAMWIIPFIIIGGALQTCGAATNRQLSKYVVKPINSQRS
jgi:bacterial/archaeal transporter family-2 protein